MSTTTVETPKPPEAMPYRLTADDYFRMVDDGILPHDRRVWLWEGRLYEKMAKKTLPHAVAFSKVVSALAQVLPPGWCLWPENPITVASDKVPLPDLTIILIRGEPDDDKRRGRRPEPSDVGLVIEIAGTSLRVDTGPTLEEYARAFLPVYWVLDLVGRRVLACRQPVVEGGRGRYDSVESFGPDQSLPLLLDGREIIRIPVRDLLDAENTP